MAILKQLDLTAECRNRDKGFTLLELIVVISIISLLSAILLPALTKAKKQARDLIKTNRQHQTAIGLSLYTANNNNWYPTTVATLGNEYNWNWYDPRKMVVEDQMTNRPYRAMSEYLRDYVKADDMYCPNAPGKHKYFQQMWDLGDSWDHPVHEGIGPDPFTGTYCFYWNYIGYLPESNTLFRGPGRTTGGRAYSKLLMSDYFGYGHFRTVKTSQNEAANVADDLVSGYGYGSCEKFYSASISNAMTEEVAADYWCSDPDKEPSISKLYAVYTDGHVESYSSNEVVVMKIIRDINKEAFYEPGDLGVFFIPENAIK